MHLSHTLTPLARVLEHPVQASYASDKHATRIAALVRQHQHRGAPAIPWSRSNNPHKTDTSVDKGKLMRRPGHAVFYPACYKKLARGRKVAHKIMYFQGWLNIVNYVDASLKNSKREFCGATRFAKNPPLTFFLSSRCLQLHDRQRTGIFLGLPNVLSRFQAFVGLWARFDQPHSRSFPNVFFLNRQHVNGVGGGGAGRVADCQSVTQGQGGARAIKVKLVVSAAHSRCFP